MNTSQEMLLELIKASLFHGGETTIDAVADIDWHKVCMEARQQTVMGLIVTALPDQVRSRWIKYAYQNAANYTRNLYAQREMVQLFSDAGIPIAILKGFAAAVYYPDPTCRSMGDIDFIVPQERFREAVALMTRSGYTRTHQEEDTARHFGFNKRRISFELHHYFSTADLDIERYVADGVQHASQGYIDGVAFPMLPPLANGLVLLAHMSFHLKTGLGLRQVIDWMMYVDKVLDDTFWTDVFQPAAEEVGLTTLAVTVTRMCQLYLGLGNRITWCRGADETLCARLMNNLLASGNFGRKKGSGQPIEAVITAFKREGLFRYLQFAGEHNWKAYKKHPGLKPFCWVYQIGRYCRQGLQAKRGMHLKEDVNYGKERHELLKELHI